MNIYYYCPNMNSPSGGIGVLLKQAKILSENGYNVKLLYEKQQVEQPDFNPTWMDFSISEIPKIKINGILNFNIGKDDLLVIPEGFGNIIEQTKDVRYKRVILAQSYAYILDSLRNPTIFWDKLNIKTVISVSDGITEYIKSITDKLNIYNYKQSINQNIFKKQNEKDLVVCFSASRGQENQTKTYNAIRYFKSITPKFNNIQFVELRGLSKIDFANTLSNSMICLYTDEIAGFGTLPLEAMAGNVLVVGFKNLGNSEYVTEGNGIWIQNGDYIQLAKKLSETVVNYFDNNINLDVLKENYHKTLEEYTEEKEKQKILEIFSEIIK